MTVLCIYVRAAELCKLLNGLLAVSAALCR